MMGGKHIVMRLKGCREYDGQGFRKERYKWVQPVCDDALECSQSSGPAGVNGLPAGNGDAL